MEFRPWILGHILWCELIEWGTWVYGRKRILQIRRLFKKRRDGASASFTHWQRDGQTFLFFLFFEDAQKHFFPSIKKKQLSHLQEDRLADTRRQYQTALNGNKRINHVARQDAADLIETFGDEQQSAEDPHWKWRRRENRGVEVTETRGGEGGMGARRGGGASHANTDHDHHVGRIWKIRHINSLWISTELCSIPPSINY